MISLLSICLFLSISILKCLLHYTWYESIQRGDFAKCLFLGVWSPGKIVSVLTKFWESSPGKFDLFLWYFFLLERIRMIKSLNARYFQAIKIFILCYNEIDWLKILAEFFLANRNLCMDVLTFWPPYKDVLSSYAGWVLE